MILASAPRPCFNGAAADEPRIRPVCRGKANHRRTSFNGAAADEPRIQQLADIEGERWQEASMGPRLMSRGYIKYLESAMDMEEALQWGRG